MKRVKTVSVEETLDWVRAHSIQDEQITPVCIWGKAGLGKASIIKEYADARDLNMVVFAPAYLSATSELLGQMVTDPTTNSSQYLPPAWLPREGSGPGILFISDLNLAKKNILSAMLDFIGTGTISPSGWRLPPGWMIVAGASPNEKGYSVTALDDALINRMLHLSLSIDPEDWNKSREDNDWGNIATDIKPLLGSKYLPADINPKATPRTLDYVGRLYDKQMDVNLLYTIARGLIGEDAATHLCNIHGS